VVHEFGNLEARLGLQLRNFVSQQEKPRGPRLPCAEPTPPAPTTSSSQRDSDSVSLRESTPWYGLLGIPCDDLHQIHTVVTASSVRVTLSLVAATPASNGSRQRRADTNVEQVCVPTQTRTRTRTNTLAAQHTPYNVSLHLYIWTSQSCPIDVQLPAAARPLQALKRAPLFRDPERATKVPRVQPGETSPAGNGVLHWVAPYCTTVMHTHMHTCVFTCIHTYIHTYVYIHTHTCIHTYTHAPHFSHVAPCCIGLHRTAPGYTTYTLTYMHTYAAHRVEFVLFCLQCVATFGHQSPPGSGRPRPGTPY